MSNQGEIQNHYSLKLNVIILFFHYLYYIFKLKLCNHLICPKSKCCVMSITGSTPEHDDIKVHSSLLTRGIHVAEEAIHC